MDIYILLWQEYDDAEVYGVFNTLENAILNTKKIIGDGTDMKRLRIVKWNVGQTIFDENPENDDVWFGWEKNALRFLLEREAVNGNDVL